jgi:hypothetical protein
MCEFFYSIHILKMLSLDYTVEYTMQDQRFPREIIHQRGGSKL